MCGCVCVQPPESLSHSVPCAPYPSALPRPPRAAGSKDGLVKLWCPKTGRCLSTLHGHQGTVMQCQWNANGNGVLTASRDQTCKVRGGAVRGGRCSWGWAYCRVLRTRAGLGCSTDSAEPTWLLASRPSDPP